MDYEDIKRQLGQLETVVKVKRAAREPHANKLTTIFKRGSDGYTVVTTFKNSRGQIVAFNVSDYVNVAGYVLTWVTTYTKNGKRHTKQLTAFKSRSAAVACAERRAKKLRQRVKAKAERFTL